MSYKEKYNLWLESEFVSEDDKKELRAIEDEKEIEDRFYKDLEFGTAGLRGVLGAGSNRMNSHTVGKVSEGLGRYLKDTYESPSCAIAYDPRIKSDEFALEAALILASKGVKVYLHENLAPVPILSYTARYYNTDAGVVITASHNPKEYNGYKAYWDDGAQMIAPHDVNVITEVMKIKDVADIKFEGNPDLIEIIGEEIDKIYLDQIKTVSLSPESVQRHHDIKIVYTPIHGTGITLVPRAFKEYIVITIVTSEVIKDVAEGNKVECYDAYTGFKWIAAIIRDNEGVKEYIGGGEESYGFLPATYVRDKDAVTSCVLMAEMVAWAKDNGKTIYELLQDIYTEYGFGKEKGISVVKTGKSGAEEILKMMSDFRKNPPQEIAGSKVKLIKDFQTLKQTNLISGETTDIEMPTKSNALQYYTEDGTKVSVRPSGTEPKIKFYIDVRDELKSRADYDAVDAAADAKISAVRESLGV